MVKNSNLYVFIGFLLFFFGTSAMVLSVVGVRFSFLAWMDSGRPMIGFLLRILMMFGGIVIALLARTDWEREIAESK